MATTYREPGRHDRNAPKLDGQPGQVSRYFEDIEWIEAQGSLGDAWMRKALTRYASPTVARQWKAIPEITDASKTWAEIKDAILKYYPGDDKPRKYTKADMMRYVTERAKNPIETREEVAAYKLGFLPLAKDCIDNGYMLKTDVEHAFLSGFTGRLRDAIDRRLYVTEVSTHVDGDPYPVEKIYECADTLLKSPSFIPPPPNEPPTSLVPTVTPTVVIKTEEPDFLAMTKQIQLLSERVEALTAASRQPDRGNASGSSYRGCIYCSDLGHSRRDCPHIAEDIKANQCAINAEGKITLPNGSYVPRNTPGATMRERHHNFLKSLAPANPINLFSVALEQPRRSAHIEDAPDADDDQQANVFVGDQAKKDGKRMKLDGVIITSKPGKPPGQREQAPTPPAPTEAQSKKQPAPTGQFRYKADIESDQVIKTVMDRALSTTVTLTVHELLAITSDGRKVLRDLITSKRVSINQLLGPLDESGHDTDDEAQPILSNNYASPSDSRQHPTRRGRVSGRKGAFDIMPIHVITAKISGKLELPCVLDTGSCVCVLSEDLWLTLGATLCPDKSLTLETATGGRADSLGQICDVPVQVGDIEVLITFEVMRDAAFDLLLGQPFFAITECETKVYENGDQHITISAPEDRRHRNKIPTMVRQVRCDQSGFP